MIPIRPTFGALVLMATLCLVLRGKCMAHDVSTAEAKALVRQALHAELNGSQERRTALLNAALKADSSYRLARWHSGQIAIGKQDGEQIWLTIDEAEKRTAANVDITDYHRIRNNQRDDAVGNITIAEWCQRRGLLNRARIHWARVLTYQPNHRNALRRVGLTEYQGRWLTRTQIATIKERRVRNAQLTKRWLPSLVALRRAFLGSDGAAQEEAQRKLARIADAELVGLLETELSPYNEQLALAVVAALASIKDQTATESLVRHAVLSKWSSVRSSATQELKSRPLHGYVPILIDGMISPYQFQTWTIRSPVDDSVRALNYSIAQKGKHADQVVQGAVNIIGRRVQDSEFTSEIADEVQEELGEKLEELNEATERFNKPIHDVLKGTTGKDFVNDPSPWNDWWNEYNEYYVPEYKPVITNYQRPSSIVAIQPYSCFPAGTLVSTETGRKPIEDIRVGDYVLSQAAESGELAYKPVLQTTVRQSDAIVKLSLEAPNDTLYVTRGHPIWVNGRQWQMAKQLRRGDVLHTANGCRRVAGNSADPRDTLVYNLVVAEFHTYFVGKARVLVHDNSLYTPPTASVPGE